MPDIYGLYDAGGDLRYIGKANDPAKRLAGHMRDARRRKSPLYDWISKHGRPEMRVLESGCVDWRESERRLIAEARERGDRLLNLADGGDEPGCSTEVRRANGRKLVERIRTDDAFRHIWHMKRRLKQDLRAGLVRNRARQMLREAAAARPDLFGIFADIPDREEEPNGDPVGGYGKLRNGGYGAPLQAY